MEKWERIKSVNCLKEKHGARLTKKMEIIGRENLKKLHFYTLKATKTLNKKKPSRMI